MNIRDGLNALPITYVDVANLKRDEDGKIVNWPPFPCWIECKYYTFDVAAKNYVEKKAPFWFDGKEFHPTTDLYNYDATDWIFELGHPAKLL
jgi:hypothetical protein